MRGIDRGRGASWAILADVEDFPHAPSGYLDAVGGQRVIDAARTAASIAQADGWADPTRLHHQGRKAGILLDAARASIAASLTSVADEPIAADEVHFAPSMAAAARAALHGIPDGIVASRVETALLLDLADERPGSLLIDVDSTGRVDLTTFARALSTGGFGCLQAANAEVGTIQPVSELARLGHGGPLLVDAGQLIGRARLPAGWTVLMASARDWAGPAGVCVVVVRRRARWQAPASAIRGWLDGFPDIPAAIGAASALEFVLPRAEAEAHRARALIDRVRSAAAAIPDVEVLGDPIDRLPHIVTFSVLYASGEAIVTEFDRRGFAVASGSACMAESQRPSHVLAAMGAYTGGNVRVSLPFGCSEASVDAFIEALPNVVGSIRGDALG